MYSSNLSNSANIRTISPGLYQIHVFIEETRGLMKDPDSVIDPVIKMAAFGTNRYSTKKSHRGTGMIYWSEHFFFEKKLSEYHEFELEKLYIQVYNHKFLKSNSLIGEIEVDVVPIYLSNNHAILHQWVGLTNIKINREEIKGFLKFSCSCIGPQDQPVPMMDEKYDDKNTKIESLQNQQFFTEGPLGDLSQGGVLFPPYIKIKGWQILIKLIKGENLVKMDNVGTIDAFLVFEFGPAKYRTNTIKNNPNPEWNMIINLPFSEPSINEILTLAIWDQDPCGKKELVVNVAFELKDIKDKDKKYDKFFWLNLYGAHPDKSKTEYGQLMDSNPSMGSFWKGRILLSIDCFQKNSPVLSDPNKIEKLGINTLKEISLGYTRWQIIVDVFYGFSFPKSDKKYSIRVRWADQEIKFDDCKIEQGVLKWYQSKSILCDFPYKQQELPDLFAYICQGQDRICFIRKTCDDLESEPKLYYFVPDKSIGKHIRKHNAGVVKLRFQVIACDFGGEQEVKKISKTLEEKKLVPGILVSHIYHAQDLIPADANGSSDPYYKISYYGKKLKGETIEKSLNPVWNKTHYLDVMIFPKEECPPIILKMYDKDSIGHDFIGSCLMDVQKGIKEKWITLEEKIVPNPVWHELQYENQTNCGKFLASFQLLEQNTIINPLKSIDIRPNTEKYFVTIKILGLRGLKSLGLLPVNRPFIRFDINGMKTIDQKESLYEKKSLQTQPTEVGSDPNICTILNFELELPIEMIYCPSLNCTIHDRILKGISEPVLGIFSINFPKYITNTNLRVQQKLAKRLSIPAPPLIIDLEKEENKSSSKKFLEIDFQSKKITEPLLKKNSPKSDIKSHKKSEILENDIYQNDGTINSDNIVKIAEYEVDKTRRLMVEKGNPDKAFFHELGYDSQINRAINKDLKKHYRHFIKTPLEDSPFMDQNTFDEFIIKRGKRFKDENNNFFKSSTLISNQKEVGKFKGWVSIMSEKNKKLLKEKNLRSRSSNTLIEKLETNILEKTLCLIRVYILRADDLPQMDLFSASDPYLKLILGKEEQNNRKEYQTDKVNCNFYKLFSFKATLPGVSQLKIQVWDYDFLVPDDLIGETTIDLENRFFSKKWRKLKHVPIETRELVHPLHAYEKNGRITLWVEIHPLPMNNNDRIWDITPKPPIDFELRIVVWEVDGVPSMDVEDCSDLYIEGNFRGKIQTTDTHFRAQNGFGSFNWRMVWPITLSDEDMDLSISFQVWDKDFFSPNDYIAEGTLEFQNEAKEAYKNDYSVKKKGKKEIKIRKKFEKLAKDLFEKNEKGAMMKEEEKFVLELKNFENTDLKFKTKGTLTLSMELVPKTVVKENPVGLGRSEPNHSPWLPPPIGRFEWSANPLTLFTRCVGPKARSKACCCLCLTICIFILISIAPIVLGNLASRLIMAFD